jgi:hypothetical protein
MIVMSHRRRVSIILILLGKRKFQSILSSSIRLMTST